MPHDLPSVAVGQAWLDQPDVARTLEQLAAFGFVRGSRHKPRANASSRDKQPGGMMDSAWRRARDFPGTPIIINHAGMPSDRSAEGLAGWRQAMRGMAQCPNVSVKISGIGLAGGRWSVEANRPVVRDTTAWMPGQARHDKAALVNARSGAPGCCRARLSGNPSPPATVPFSCA